VVKFSWGWSFPVPHSLCSMGSVMVLLDICLKTTRRKYFSAKPVIQLRSSLPYGVSDVKAEMRWVDWVDLEKKSHQEQTLTQSSLRHLLAGKISCGQQGPLSAMFSGSSICWRLLPETAYRNKWSFRQTKVS